MVEKEPQAKAKKRSSQRTQSSYDLSLFGTPMINPSWFGSPFDATPKRKSRPKK